MSALRRPLRLVLRGLALAVIAVPSLVLAQEETTRETVISYLTEIMVNQDASVLVNETIRVRSNADKVKTGITRVIPTRFRDTAGNKFNIKVEIKAVSRNGMPEASWLAGVKNGLALRIGADELRPGVHTYIINYKTYGHVGFSRRVDTLYINAIPHMSLPIHKAEVRLTFPPGVPLSSIEYSGVTGFPRSKGKDFETEREGNNRIIYRISKPLGFMEGFSAYVAWPKGYVHEPLPIEKAIAYVWGNRDVFIGILGLMMIASYYLQVWKTARLDMIGGVRIAPIADPPPGLAPADVRYLNRMSFDNKHLTCAILSLASKGHIKIVDAGDSSCLVKLPHSGKKLTPYEEKIAEILFEDDTDVYLSPSFGARIVGAMMLLKDVLSYTHDAEHFYRNARYLFMGMAVTICTLLTMVVSQAPYYQQSLNFENSVIVVFFVAINGVFYLILNRRTMPGKYVRDQIEGFKKFINLPPAPFHAEREPMQMFEDYFPYAAALDMEHKWSERFFSPEIGQEEDEVSYQPTWYEGKLIERLRPTRFLSTLSSKISGHITSAITPPGEDGREAMSGR